MFDFFYSDPHFGFDNVRGARGFETHDEHHAHLVERYNTMVTSPEECVAWLGDVSRLDLGRTREILSSMTGRKVLVPGNWDQHLPPEWFYKAGFDLVLPYQVRYFLGDRAVQLSHLPFGSPGAKEGKHGALRPPRHKGEALIHGHSHTKRRVKGRQINVCCEAWDLRPVTRAEILALLEDIPVGGSPKSRRDGQWRVT